MIRYNRYDNNNISNAGTYVNNNIIYEKIISRMITASDTYMNVEDVILYRAVSFFLIKSINHTKRIIASMIKSMMQLRL